MLFNLQTMSRDCVGHGLQNIETVINRGLSGPQCYRKSKIYENLKIFWNCSKVPHLTCEFLILWFTK